MSCQAWAIGPCNGFRRVDFASRLYVAADNAVGFAQKLRESDQAVIRGLRFPAPPDPDLEPADDNLSPVEEVA